MTTKIALNLMLVLITCGLAGCGGTEGLDLESRSQAVAQPRWAMITLTKAERLTVEQKGTVTLALDQENIVTPLKDVFPKWTSGQATVSADDLGTMVRVALLGNDLVSVTAPGIIIKPLVNPLFIQYVTIRLDGPQVKYLLKNQQAFLSLQFSDAANGLLKKNFPGWTSGGVYAKADDLFSTVRIKESAPDMVSIDAPDVVGIDAPDVLGIDAPDVLGIDAPDVVGICAPDVLGLQGAPWN